MQSQKNLKRPRSEYENNSLFLSLDNKEISSYFGARLLNSFPGNSINWLSGILMEHALYDLVPILSEEPTIELLSNLLSPSLKYAIACDLLLASVKEINTSDYQKASEAAFCLFYSSALHNQNQDALAFVAVGLYSAGQIDLAKEIFAKEEKYGNKLNALGLHVMQMDRFEQEAQMYIKRILNEFESQKEHEAGCDFLRMLGRAHIHQSSYKVAEICYRLSDEKYSPLSVSAAIKTSEQKEVKIMPMTFASLQKSLSFLSVFFPPGSAPRTSLSSSSSSLSSSPGPSSVSSLSSSSSSLSSSLSDSSSSSGLSSLLGDHSSSSSLLSGSSSLLSSSSSSSSFGSANNMHPPEVMAFLSLLVSKKIQSYILDFPLGEDEDIDESLIDAIKAEFPISLEAVLNSLTSLQIDKLAKHIVSSSSFSADDNFIAQLLFQQLAYDEKLPNPVVLQQSSLWASFPPHKKTKTESVKKESKKTMPKSDIAKGKEIFENTDEDKKDPLDAEELMNVKAYVFDVINSLDPEEGALMKYPDILDELNIKMSVLPISREKVETILVGLKRLYQELNERHLAARPLMGGGGGGR